MSDVPLKKLINMRTLRWGSTALAILLVTGIAGFWGFRSLKACADGVAKQGQHGECVGVTDGSFHFSEHLAKVEDKIYAENKRIKDAKKEYVSVAYMTSFTLTDDDSNSPESVRRELEGAYLAQYRNNQGDQDGEPKIRLLVANVGSKAEQWEYTVERLAELKDSDDRLVAVAGLGSSTDVTRAAMKRLAEHKLAMVGSVITATNLSDIPGLVRVAPTNRDEAHAAAAYLKRSGTKTALVIQDEAEGNLYAKTLGEEFSKVFPDRAGHRLVGETSTYDSGQNSWKNELRWMTGPLCNQKPEMVFFAGRGVHLTHFLDALSNRTCPEQRFTVMAGDDTTNVTPFELAKAAGSGIDVLYTGLAHPDLGQKDNKAVNPAAAKQVRAGGLLDQWFHEDPREDGQAIMAHDAVLSAVQGVRMAAANDGTITGEAVTRMFRQMEHPQEVPGASGFISFANNGDPRNKAVPILRLRPNGSVVLVEVSAPRGEPPTGSDTAVP